MRKIVLLMHVSIDGFVAGPAGEMDWIRFSGDVWEYVESITGEADTALYGANTYAMMESHWPTAADAPQATKRDIDHARWANNVEQIAFSTQLEATSWANSRIVREDVAKEMGELKSRPGTNLLMLGSPTLAQSFMRLEPIDEFRLNVNPVALGGGIALFDGLEGHVDLDLVGTRVFTTGVVGLHYQTVR
jgi:dihydrofolate reductase